MFDIQTLQMTEGALPTRVRGFIVEWATLHQQELLAAWEAVRSRRAPAKIAPLE